MAVSQPHYIPHCNIGHYVSVYPSTTEGAATLSAYVLSFSHTNLWLTCYKCNKNIYTVQLKKLMIFYIHWQHMVPDYCTKYEQNQPILLCNIATLKIYETNGHDYSNLVQSQILFYVNQQPMVPDHSTQYEENPSSHHGRMHEEGLTNGMMDWTLSYSRYYPYAEHGIKINPWTSNTLNL